MCLRKSGGGGGGGESAIRVECGDVTDTSAMPWAKCYTKIFRDDGRLAMRAGRSAVRGSEQ
jgi:hypothetical protein